MCTLSRLLLKSLGEEHQFVSRKVRSIPLHHVTTKFIGKLPYIAIYQTELISWKKVLAYKCSQFDLRVKMNQLILKVDRDTKAYYPCDIVRGQLAWRFAFDLRALLMRLYWYTQGIGIQDVGVARSLRFEAPGLRGEKEFCLAFPSYPYSFAGSLMSVGWALEVVSEPDGAVASVGLVMSPTGQEIGIAPQGDLSRPRETCSRSGRKPMGAPLGVPFQYETTISILDKLRGNRKR
jgi:hypothetical protein